ncbi:hypothetical protein WJX81_005642 [Elliptochloris bilobata]|uniref:Flavanone 4-reductase n=1 Tax=Elliptochloris bilobata TaxID=381761 RepID=A0AAW1S812_9CHLO
MAEVVVVTGASGFVAGELVKQLLAKGYTVRGTVRSLGSVYKVAHLIALGQALPGTLELHEADLLQEGSFDSVVQGARYVFHTASPFVIQVEDTQRDLIDPAVKGTSNVLAAAAKAKASVKRVVLTSSVAAVHGEYAAPPVSGSLYSEADWNETSTAENGQAYHLSKALAEREAWELAEASGLDMVAILPNFVLGPVLSSRADGLSAGFVKGLVEGKAAEGTPIICDVRDVAAAHVAAAELPAASGRYIVSQRAPITPSLVAEVLRARFPEFAIPDVPPGEWDVRERIDNSRAERELGLRLTPPCATLVDAAATLIAVGAAQPLPSGCAADAGAEAVV